MSKHITFAEYLKLCVENGVKLSFYQQPYFEPGEVALALSYGGTVVEERFIADGKDETLNNAVIKVNRQFVAAMNRKKKYGRK